MSTARKARFALQAVGSLGPLAPALMKTDHSSSFALDDMCPSGYVHRGWSINEDRAETYDNSCEVHELHWVMDLDFVANDELLRLCDLHMRLSYVERCCDSRVVSDWPHRRFRVVWPCTLIVWRWWWWTARSMITLVVPLLVC